MIRCLPLICVMVAGVVQADPMFEDITDRVPKHQYTGGWEHFVGGGVSVFDCSNDGLPDIVAAGGASPMILLKNVSDNGEIAFEPMASLGDLTGVTGAYPIDMDGDAVLDLYVIRGGTRARSFPRLPLVTMSIGRTPKGRLAPAIPTPSCRPLQEIRQVTPPKRLGPDIAPCRCWPPKTRAG